MKNESPNALNNSPIIHDQNCPAIGSRKQWEPLPLSYHVGDVFGDPFYIYISVHVIGLVWFGLVFVFLFYFSSFLSSIFLFLIGFSLNSLSLPVLHLCWIAALSHSLPNISIPSHTSFLGITSRAASTLWPPHDPVCAVPPIVSSKF